MLRRNSAKSRSDLARRKSTSSVHGVRLEHIDPAVAQRDAQIAACQAFTRAQDRDKTDMPLFPPTPESSPRRRQPGSTSRGQDGLTTPNHGAEGGQDLRHRQSVRFMGPCSVQDRTSQDLDPSSNRKNRGLDPFPSRDGYDTTSSRRHVLESSDSPNQARQATMPRLEVPPIPLPGIAADYLGALMAEEEYYIPEDDIASAPSSFRRLRRSRSMFTSDETGARPSQDTTRTYLNGRLPGPRLPPPVNTRRPFHSRSNENPPPRDIAQLRAPKSMSFLRNRNTRSGSTTTQDGTGRELGLRLAPDHTRHGFREPSQDSPRLISKSSFFSSRSHRADPGIRKSLRSNGSVDDPSTAKPSAPVKEERFKVKARKVSKSLKIKLKSLFNLSKSEEEPPSFPPQHIVAQRTHVTDGFTSPRSSHEDQDSRSDLGWRSIHRVPSNIPSLQTVPPNLAHSSRVSLESLKGANDRKVSDDKSLTSWAASGPSTLTSQQQHEWKEWERQRLSIIKENGAHAPSNSMRRKALGVQLFQGQDTNGDGSISPGPIVDSQRVYSALMKRAQESNKQTNAAPAHQPSSGGMFQGLLSKMPSIESLRRVSRKTAETANSMPTRNGHSVSPNNNDTPTRSSKKGTLRLGRQGAHGGQLRAHVPSPPHPFPMEAVPAGEYQRNGVTESSCEKPSHGSRTSSVSNSLQDPFVDNDNCLSQAPDQIHHPNGLDSLSGYESASLNTPTSHLFRTRPPYRQALQISMEAEQNAHQHQYCPGGQVSMEENTPIQQHIHSTSHIQGTDSDSTNDAQYSESVYSTDEYYQDQGQGHCEPGTERRNKTANVDNGSHEDAGSPHTYRPAGYRGGSSGSSIDWKTWLSANVAKFESSPTPPKLSEVEYALPTMPKNFPTGHIRESAQTHDDEEEVAEIFEPPTHKPTLPTSPLATVEPNVPKISPVQRSIKRATPPSGGRALPENDSPSATPPIPPKSTLRAAPSPLKHAGPNIVYSLPSSLNSSPGLTLAVRRQFGFAPKSSEAAHSNRQRRDSHEAGYRQEKYGSYGGRSSGLGREDNQMMNEQICHSGQKGAANHDETMAFI